MSFLLLGFFTGLSLILAIGAQNIFVIEQGLKKQYVFLVCLICSISDLLLIFLGIFLFEYFRNFFTDNVSLIEKRLQSLRQADDITKLWDDYAHTRNLHKIWELPENLKVKNSSKDSIFKLCNHQKYKTCYCCHWP